MAAKKKEKAEKSRPARRVLGKGLDALLPDIGNVDTAAPTYFSCSLQEIQPNRFQPRKSFSQAELAELADSIKRQGVIQPLIVRQGENRGYELVAGERRLRAAGQAGLTEVPVVVMDVSDEEALQMTIVENIQRENLNPMEECEGYHRLISEFALTQEEVSRRVGKKRSTVANFLRLMNLPAVIQDSLREGALSMGHARALLGLDNRARQMLAYKTVLSKGLSVRATEELVEALKGDNNGPANPPAKKPEDVHLSDLADELSRALGTRVRIQKKGKRGRLTIDFYANEDLERLLALLRGEA